jgi:hypothetical protein
MSILMQAGLLAGNSIGGEGFGAAEVRPESPAMFS